MKMEWLSIAAIFLPMLMGILLLLLKEKENRKKRNIYVFASTFACALLVVAACIAGGEVTLFNLVKDMPIAFRVDGASVLFAVLSAFMWLCTSIYSFEYMKHEKKEKLFYSFYLISLSSVIGICFSANLVTLYMFYEMMTLSTLPLVLHNRSREALSAALKYMIYSIGGALLSLFGMFLLSGSSNMDFVFGGSMNITGEASTVTLVAALLCIIGFGSKAGMFPLHGWLPTAHPVAPSPASALLSGNITKMGVLAIFRVIYYVIGADKLSGTWVQYTFIALSLGTVLMGSMMAYREQLLKKRLAYSTVSQVSYILFGLSLMNATALTGAMMHVVFHSIIKNALFYTAGIIIMKTGKTRVDELQSIGKKLPYTMMMFSVAALALVGIPPFSGFVSKWYLCIGSLDSGTGFLTWFGPVVLLVSALLTAGYLFPISIKGFFPGRDESESAEKVSLIEPSTLTRSALLILTILTFIFGVFPEPLKEMIMSWGGM